MLYSSWNPDNIDFDALWISFVFRHLHPQLTDLNCDCMKAMQKLWDEASLEFEKVVPLPVKAIRELIGLHSVFFIYIFDYTTQILYDKSRRFGTYSSAFSVQWQKTDKNWCIKSKRKEGVELNTGSNLIKREQAQNAKKGRGQQVSILFQTGSHTQLGVTHSLCSGCSWSGG